MYRKEIDNLSHSAEVKIGLFNKSIAKYITSAMLGSFFVSLGMMLIYTIGGIMHHADMGAYKIVMGLSFGVALSLVFMAGGDLFTSNAMIMTVGALEKKVTWLDAVKIYISSDRLYVKLNGDSIDGSSKEVKTKTADTIKKIVDISTITRYLNVSLILIDLHLD